MGEILKVHATRRFLSDIIFLFLLVIIYSNIYGAENSFPCGADTTKKLDLMITCQMQGAQERRYYVKIINRSNAPIYYSNANLSMKLWVNEPQLRCVVVTGQNGEVFNASGIRVGNVQIQGNTYSNFYQVPYFQENAQHRANQEAQVGFVYQGGEVNYIPAGGWVQGFQIMITASCSFMSQNYRPLYAYLGSNVYSDASYYNTYASLPGNWTDFSDDYSGLPYGQNSCSGNMAGPYYDDRHFALYSNNTLIGEYKTPGTYDSQTGVPPGAGSCTPIPTIIITKTATATVSITLTSTPTATLTATKSATQSATASNTASVTKTNTASFTETATLTGTPTITTTATPTFSETLTITESITSTITVTASKTATSSATNTATESITITNTPSYTGTPTNTVTKTATETISKTITLTATDTVTVTATCSVTETATETVTLTPTPTVTRTVTETVTGTATLTPTPTATLTVTETATETITGTITETVTETATGTLTLTPTPTATATITETATDTITVTITETATETITETVTEIATMTVTLTSTPSVTATFTGTITKTETPTITESITATITMTSTLTITITVTRTSTPAAPCFKFTTKFSSPNNNRGITIGNTGNVFISIWDGTYNHRVLKFKTTGEFIKEWNGQGTTEGRFGAPGRIMAANGRIYVADSEKSRIQMFDENGIGLGTFGTAGTGDGQFNLVYDISTDNAGNLYTADSGNNRIQKFTEEGIFIKAWGTKGVYNGQLNVPNCVAIGPDSNVYVYEQNNYRVSVFDTEGNFIRLWGISGTAAGQFNTIMNIKFGLDGLLYMSEHSNNGDADRIQIFDVYGNYIGRAGNKGSGDGQIENAYFAFDADGSMWVGDLYARIQKLLSCGTAPTFTPTPTVMPTINIPCFEYSGKLTNPAEGLLYMNGITTDKNGNIYISMSNLHRIQVFSSKFGYLKQIGLAGNSDGQFNTPTYITISDDEELYVIDEGNSRIQVFDLQGNFKRKWGSYGTAEGEFNSITGLVIDNKGFVYVTDNNNFRIQKFTEQGEFLKTWGSKGNFYGQFNEPLGITIGPDGGIYVADDANHRITVFDAEGNYIRHWEMSGANKQAINKMHTMQFGSDGFLYASNFYNAGSTYISSIYISDMYGNYIGSIGTQGYQDGQFSNPKMTVDARGDIFTISDTRVQKFIQCTMVPSPTPTATAMPELFNCFIFDSYFGEFEQFKSLGMVSDLSNQIYVSNPEKKMVGVFNKFGHCINIIGNKGEGSALLQKPGRLAINKEGKVFVIDESVFQVKIYDKNGLFLNSFGGTGNENGKFNSPSAITINSAGNVYVTDSGNNRVQIFDCDGNFLSKIGSVGSYAGLMKSPGAIAIDKEDNVYVVENGNKRVQVFDKHGDYMRIWNVNISNSIEAKIGPDNNLYISDDSSKILIFNTFGAPSGTLLSGEQPLYGISYPVFAFDENRMLVIADSMTRKIKKFHRCSDTGMIDPVQLFPVRNPDLPDISVISINVSKLSGDWQKLLINGIVDVTVQNMGDSGISKKIDIIIFEDLNDNHIFDMEYDNVFGTVSADGLEVNEQKTLSLSISGTVLFRGNAILAFADSVNDVAEINEKNNYGSSVDLCIGLKPKFEFDPVLKWSWKNPEYLSGYSGVVTMPVVADLNSDGRTEIVINSGMYWNYPGFIRIIDGMTGLLLNTIEGFSVHYNIDMTVADIDMDGMMEIMAIDHTGSFFMAFEHDGTLKWKSENIPNSNTGRISVADMDTDGVPEIVIGAVIYNNSGKIKHFSENGGMEANGTTFGTSSIVADINLDGKPEIINGNTVYNNDAAVLWRNNSFRYGYNAVANFDADAYPEIVVVTGKSVWLLENDGTVKWGPITINEIKGGGGPPVAADFDADGIPDIGVGFENKYVCIKSDGTILWSNDVLDQTGGPGFQGTTAFDFDGNGIPEIIYQDQNYFYIFDGKTGSILLKQPFKCGTFLEYPVVADIDGNGHAELLAVSGENNNLGLFVYQDRYDRWANAGKIWNQHSFHITNVRQDGTVPKNEMNKWEVYNNYRVNQPINECITVWPDLTASFLRVTPRVNGNILTARIGNGGSDKVEKGVFVSFYGGDPQNGGNLLGIANTGLLLATSDFEDVSVFVPDTVCVCGPIWISADDKGVLNGELDELSEINNLHNSGIYLGVICTPVPDCTKTPGLTCISTSISTFAPTDTVTFTVTATNTPTATETMTGTPPTETVTPTVTITPVTSIVDILKFEIVNDTSQTDTDGAVVTQRVNVIGSVISAAFDHYTLEYAETGKNAWVVIATGTTQGINIVLGILDPTMLLNGQYNIRLRLYETDGNYLGVNSGAFTIEGNMKIGNFTLSFNDLSVPVAGVPMEINRSYDSRQKIKGDFGYGWNLSVSSIKVQESNVIGDDWYTTIRSGFGGYGLIDIKPKMSKIVSVSMPDGVVYRFEMKVIPNAVQTLSGGVFTVSLTPLSGTKSLLRSLDTGNQIIAEGYVPGDIRWFDLNSGSLYDPEIYELTTQDGTKYVISQTDGLQSMEDTNGNKLTINSTGVHHSSGKDISFTRDVEGRITRITAPDGKYLSYTYDASGDLVEFKDRVQTADSSKGAIIYSYYADGKHNLKDISDPRDNANKPITNHYDESGRLTKHVDAKGQEIFYSYDMAHNKVSSTNRLLKSTDYEYDERGNVTKKTEYNIGIPYVTNYEYDEYDNKKKESLVNKPGIYTGYKYEDLNPGTGYAVITKDMRLVTEQIDPEGNHTYYKYDANGRVLKTIDPRGFATENYYDAKGNLMWTKDAKGYYTYYDYDSQGNMTYMKDAENNETTYAYTGGYMTSQTQGGITTAYTYDAMGNMVTESRPEPNDETGTLTTIYSYDNNGRQIKTTNFDTTFTETAYDSLGKPVVRSDKKGRETETAYDEMGRVDYVLRPDGAKDVNHYDNEGRLTWVESYNKNFELKNTYHEYDDLGRKTRSNYHGGSYSISVYDEQGRVAEERGRDGVITSYTYDNSGRRMSMIRGNYHVSYGYDANGNQVSSTDANGTITNHYDELNRLTQTDYPENRYKYYEYDKTGRKTQEKDEENKITKFGYDATGKLTGVKQYLDGVELTTSYAYDKPGNQISQTDAKINVTGYRYDGMNRRVNKTLPSGIAEVYHYDPQTDLMDYMTDFNGDRADYLYDTDADKLTSETTKDTIVTYGYDAWNRRDEMASNGESFGYNYDSSDNLTNKNWARGNVVYTRSVEGRLTNIATNHGYSTGYTYYSDGLLAGKTDNGTTQYQYDSINNLDTVEYANGVTTDYDYNKANKLTKVTVKKDGVTIASWDYTLSPSGNKTSVTESTGRAITWAYDDLYRLKDENILSGSITGAIGYDYDVVGNRELRNSSITPIPTQVFAYDANDRVTSYTWDNNGNLLSDGTNIYTWNGKNELVRVISAGVDVSYGYDGDGLRISRTDNLTGVATYYIWDTENPTGYPQVIEEVENNVVVKRYGYGHYLEIIDILNGTTYERFYVVRDGTTSVRMLLDSTGNIAATYDYEAFGDIISQTNSNALAIANTFGYDSEYKDPTTGLIYLRARWYKPSDGRFVSRDKWEGDKSKPITNNKYIAFNSNSLTYIDPRGTYASGILGASQVASRLLKGYIINAQEMPPIPDHIMVPYGVDILENIKLAKEHFLDTAWFVSMVNYNRPWDYKTLSTERYKGLLVYERFGNFHYGIVGKAAGFPDAVLLREAGRAQLNNPSSVKGPGNPGGLGLERYSPFDNVGEAPYGDEWVDYYYIKEGFDYYRQIKWRGLI